MTSGDKEAILMLTEPPPQNYVPPKNDPRRVVIQKIELVFKDHQTAVLEVETPEQQANARKTPLIIKEGAEYKIRVTFRVQHQLVAGLKCVAGKRSLAYANLEIVLHDAWGTMLESDEM
jgi:hypothetical protein